MNGWDAVERNMCLAAMRADKEKTQRRGEMLGAAIEEMLRSVSDDFLEINIAAERGMNGYWKFKVNAKQVDLEDERIVLSEAKFVKEEPN